MTSFLDEIPLQYIEHHSYGDSELNNDPFEDNSYVIDYDHEDLNVNIADSVSFLGGKESDNPDDQNGHGTHVAGIIHYVAPEAEIMPIRVLDSDGWICVHILLHQTQLLATYVHSRWLLDFQGLVHSE